MSKYLIITALAVSCLLFAGCPGDDAPAGKSANTKKTAARPEPAPPARTTGAPNRPPARGAGGASLFRLPDVAGRPVTVKTPAVLYFFTSWCGVCKQVLPDFKRVTERARNMGWWVYGVDVREGPQQMQSYIANYQPNFPILMDQQGVVASQYGVTGYPTFVLVDESANIVYNSHGVPTRF